MGKWKRLLSGFLLLLIVILVEASSVQAVPNPYSIQWGATPVVFVQSLYQGVLGRNPRTVADWQSVESRAQLVGNDCRLRYDMFWEFINSKEYQASRWAEVPRVYSVCYDNRRAEWPSGGEYPCRCYHFAEHCTGYRATFQFTGVPYPATLLTFGEAAALSRLYYTCDRERCPNFFDCGGEFKPFPDANGQQTHPANGQQPQPPPYLSPQPYLNPQPQAGCTCEDWDHDGKFGVVLNHKVLKSNIGSYDQCIRYAKTLNQCGGAESSVDYQGNERNTPVEVFGNSQVFITAEEYLDNIKNTDSANECPTENPGTELRITLPKKHDGNYIYCEYYSNGALGYQVTYENSKKTGLAIAYFRDGQLKERAEYQDNKLHGYFERFNFKNGKYFKVMDGRNENGFQVKNSVKRYREPQ